MVQSSESTDPVRRFLDSAGLRDGDRIPAERELADRIGISRRRLRRSLARMEAEGLIWRAVGKGTWLGAGPLPNPSIATWRGVGPSQIMQARLVLEPAIAADAALHASALDLARIEKCVHKNLAVQSDPEWELWDAAFHRAIAEATGNPIVIAVMNGLGEARAGIEWGNLRRAVVLTA